MPRIKSPIIPTTIVLVLIAVTPKGRKAQIFRHPHIFANRNRPVTVSVTAIHKRRAIVQLIFIGRIHQATHRISIVLNCRLHHKIIIIIRQCPSKSPQGIPFRPRPESCKELTTCKNTRRIAVSRRKPRKAETILAQQHIVTFLPPFACTQIRPRAHGIVNILQVRNQILEIENRRDMPTIRANSPRLTFHHGIPSNRSRKLLVQFHRNSPRIQPAKFFAVFFLVLVAKTSRHIHIQVIDHPNLIADMNRPKFLILHLNHLRNNLARRRRRFLDFVQLIFYASNRDAVILAGIDLFHSP